MSQFKIDDVIKIETKIIKKQRKVRGVKINNSDDPKLGLALSGGGIRSASFAMGVVQSLQQFDLFKEIDYLSTVSGGGYLGSAITWFQSTGEPLFEKNKTEAPIFSKKDCGARSFPPKKNQGSFIDYIRQHGNYLTPDHHLISISMAGQVLANILIAILVYFSLLLSSLCFLVYIGFFEPTIGSFSIAILLAAALFLFATLKAIISSVISQGKKEGDKSGYYQRIKTQKEYGHIMIVSGFLLALASLQPFKEFVNNEQIQIGGFIPLLLGVIGAFYELSNIHINKILTSKYVSLRIWIIALLLIYGLFYSAYLIALYFTDNTLALTIELAFLALFIGWFTNLNMFGINRMYRDRLMEAFMPNFDNVKENKWGLATDADKKKVMDMCGEGVFHNNYRLKHPDFNKISTPGPYHLINTNVVLNDSKEAKFRGRGGDNFIISPAFSGSDATDWYPTSEFVEGTISQATAMAISGAALNPGAGVGGKGATRNRLVSFMMAFFHLRLGWWLPNPNSKLQSKFLKKPNFICPGLSQGVFAFNTKEDSNFIELTDGGHFENTGIYELIRRKLPLIILSQAGADPKFTLEDIAGALEKVKVDFGVHIKFIKHYGIENLTPNNQTENTVLTERLEYSKNGFALATIHYPNKTKKGYLMIIKSLMIEDLPPSLFHYKSTHKNFPNQTTADQFFNENQFEAYRELGYQLTKQMCGTLLSKNSKKDSELPELIDLKKQLAALLKTKKK